MATLSTCHPIDTEAASGWELVGSPSVVGHGTFVQRSAARGRPWLRLMWLDSRWCVSAYKSKREAIAGDFGYNRTSVQFPYGTNPFQ